MKGTNGGGEGAAGGTPGHGGAADSNGGNGGGDVIGSGGVTASGGFVGSGGAGGAGGVSCDNLATQYTDALATAQRCDVNTSGQCQQLVTSSLSPCSLSCMTYVNDPTALNAIKASWVQAGCNNVKVSCPLIACLQPTNNMCLVGEGGVGICSSNSGGGGGSGGHGGAAGGSSGAAGGTSGHGGASGSNGGNGGGGGTGAVTCANLATQYAAALGAAQRCDISASGQCQYFVSSSLSFCACMTYVNDPTALNAIKASWVEAGCVDVSCPALGCGNQTTPICSPGVTGGRCTWLQA